MDKIIKQMYEDLLEGGELLEIFPELTRKGQENTWENDKVKFIKLYKQINKPPDTEFISFEQL